MDLIAAILLGLTVFGLAGLPWRSGVFVILCVGFLQDPLRKLVPGEPVAISATVALVMLLVWGMGVTRFSGYAEAMSLRRHYPELVRALTLFGGLVLFQSMVTIVNFGSLALAGIGLIAYLSPMPAIWIGWWFCRTKADIPRWFLLYAVFGIVAALGVYLSWLEVDWAILQSVGGKVVIYDPVLGTLDTHAGFMRTPEIAAWHMGAAVCFLIVLAIIRPTTGPIALISLAISLIIPAIVLTGRRKALGMIGLFAGFLIILFQFSRSRDARRATIALVGLALGTISMLFYLSEDASDASTFRIYSDRSGTVYDDAWGRFYHLGIASVSWAIDQVGFFGYGAGVVSQGGQHFGADMGMAGAAEGGLGKIILELGIPGLLVLAWVGAIVAASFRRIVRSVDVVDPVISMTTLCLIAFFMVNVILFITASQVFGDPFVLIVLGMLFGATLATSVIGLRRPAVVGTAFLPRGSVRGMPEDRAGGAQY